MDLQIDEPPGGFISVFLRRLFARPHTGDLRNFLLQGYSTTLGLVGIGSHVGDRVDRPPRAGASGVG